tara:strand:+ start:3002 stop:3625 length:624 start_codon:yes stop_codon:yes gene_type:complete
MALNTYALLQTSIADQLNRTDLTAEIKDAILLTEKRLNRVLKYPKLEKRATATLNAEFEAVPSDMLEMVSIKLKTNPESTVEQVSYDQLHELVPSTSTGKPRYFARQGKELTFRPIPDATGYTAELIYQAEIAELSDSNTTNDVLTDFPDLYLYGSLIHMEAHVKNDERIALWTTLFNEALLEAQKNSQASKYGGGLLRMKPGFAVT